MNQTLIVKLVQGNPGALAFVREALDINYYQAKECFERMIWNNITGSKLYMLWNDCCNRDTNKALNIMSSHTIEDIIFHINYENGRGIEYEEYANGDIRYIKIPKGGIGELSDGYHTFNELYHHRAILFSVICNSMPDKAWKSKLHDTGDMFEGMFIVGIETPHGQATYHYDIEPYWDIFRVKELERAPKYDGHTPNDAIERISKIKF